MEEKASLLSTNGAQRGFYIRADKKKWSADRREIGSWTPRLYCTVLYSWLAGSSIRHGGG